MLSSADQKKLDDLEKAFEKGIETFVGYPCTTGFDYSDLYRFLKYPVNNVGDPFSDGLYQLHTRDFEVEVVKWFASLNHAPKDNYWGYITNGGTEGNMYGLYLGRELYPDGIVYYSQDTHYSVSKSLRLLNIQHIMVRSLESGEIDYDDLHQAIKAHRTSPPIIFANIGTTMKEGIDDLQKIHKVLRRLAIPEYYIHCDAALCGMTLPFINDTRVQPSYDFRAGAQSLAISGHKFIGSPIPCGVVLALKSNVGRVTRAVEYVGSLDTTLTGSRNGISCLMLWYAVKKYGFTGFKKLVRNCIDTAARGVARMNDANINAWRHDNAITIVLPRPSEKICRKWQLAVQDDMAHMVVTPHVTDQVIDRYISDVIAE